MFNWQLFIKTRYGRNVTERSVQGTSEVENDDGVSVVKMLLDHKADINKKDVYEFTPLHHASLRCIILILLIVLKYAPLEET